MAEIPNHQIVDAQTNLEQILNDSRKAPVKLVYAAKKNHQKVSEEAEQLEEFRMDLLKDYAETDESGQVQQKTDEEGEPTGEAKFKSEEDLEEFQERLNEIWQESADIDVHSVNIDKVGDYNAPPNWGSTLDFMLEGFEETTETLRGSEIQASVNSIESILNAEESEEELPLKFSSSLLRTYRNLLEVQQDIEQRRFELLSEHAARDEEGNIKTRQGTQDAMFENPEAEEEFQEALSEIYNEEFEVDASVVEIDYLDDVELHPRHTIILDYLFVE
jgi:hypothetical protein